MSKPAPRSDFCEMSIIGVKLAARMPTSSRSSRVAAGAMPPDRSLRATSNWPVRMARSARSCRISDLAISRLVRSWPIS
ncbi:hypothetical protein [Rhizobium tibeticum]|uniref:hypothetical protein n=1 Tax=Rhizobium tibeticum TaxID=501024 RepID=UPI0014289498|nr:hypothetical protein [Rhizobium tibeticum]